MVLSVYIFRLAERHRFSYQTCAKGCEDVDVKTLEKAKISVWSQHVVTQESAADWGFIGIPVGERAVTSLFYTGVEWTHLLLTVSRWEMKYVTQKCNLEKRNKCNIYGPLYVCMRACVRTSIHTHTHFCVLTLVTYSKVFILLGLWGHLLEARTFCLDLTTSMDSLRLELGLGWDQGQGVRRGGEVSGWGAGCCLLSIKVPTKI